MSEPTIESQIAEMTRQLRDGLMATFDSWTAVEEFFREFLSDNAHLHTSSKVRLPIAWFKIIQVAQARGWLERLVEAAYAARPDAAELTALYALTQRRNETLDGLSKLYSSWDDLSMVLSDARLRPAAEYTVPTGIRRAWHIVLSRVGDEGIRRLTIIAFNDAPRAPGMQTSYVRYGLLD